MLKNGAEPLKETRKLKKAKSTMNVGAETLGGGNARAVVRLLLQRRISSSSPRHSKSMSLIIS